MSEMSRDTAGVIVPPPLIPDSVLLVGLALFLVPMRLLDHRRRRHCDSPTQSAVIRHFDVRLGDSSSVILRAVSEAAIDGANLLRQKSMSGSTT
jgi:hypothetical protein